MKKSFFAAALAAFFMLGSAQTVLAEESPTLEEMLKAYTKYYDQEQKEIAEIKDDLSFDEYMEASITAYRQHKIFLYNKLLDKAEKAMAALGKSEEDNERRGYYYQIKAEGYIYAKKIDEFYKTAKVCEKYSKTKASSLYYLSGTIFFGVAEKIQVERKLPLTSEKSRLIKLKSDYYGKSMKDFKKAFSLDPKLSLITAEDVNTFILLCSRSDIYTPELPRFFDRYFSSDKTFYIENIGVTACSAYEKAGLNAKAVLIAMIDKEFSDGWEEVPADEFIAVLAKNFKNSKNALELVRKFYDNDSEITEEDLGKIKGIEDFLPVRYMYKMKNSNDIDALHKEFGAFFAKVPRFLQRLSEKAAASGYRETAESYARMSELLINEKIKK